jgi:hypothetical protein
MDSGYAGSVMRLRSLLWLLAVTALRLPSFAGLAVASDRMSHPVMSDCGHESPPPCPEKDSAKHAAGLCCPFMSGSMAVLPTLAAEVPRSLHSAFRPPAASRLSGLSPDKDPPPPRV